MDERGRAADDLLGHPDRIDTICTLKVMRQGRSLGGR